jgi:hypothetical protein
MPERNYMNLGWFMFVSDGDEYYLEHDESVDNFFLYFMEQINTQQIIEKHIKNG